MKRLGAAFVPLLLIAALTACGGESEDATDDPTTPTSTATGAPTEDTEATDDAGDVAGDGYSYDLPDGWEEATDRFKEINQMVDTGALASGDQAADGFAENINVIAEDFPGSLDEYLDIALPLIEKQASHVTRLDDTEVGDQPAAHVTSEQGSAGKLIYTDQYLVSHNDRIYVISLSFAKSADEAERTEITAEVLDSFEWDAA